MKEFFLKAKDGYTLELHKYEVENPKAIVQVIHGMEEHQGRYERFASTLNQKGYTVITSDMRGHGNSAPDLGYFKNKDGWKYLIEDQNEITAHIKSSYPEKPIYLFAHSMGTIIARNVLQKNSSIYSKAVFSGYPNFKVGTSIGIFLANIIIELKGEKYRSKLLKCVSTGAFNKKIKNPKSNHDWVCYDEKTQKEYKEDALCGFGFTSEAYRDLFYLVKRMHEIKLYEDINSDLKILLLSGEDDPCTGYEHGRKDSIKILRKAGFKNIESIEYPNMRHEILNEERNDLVYRDILRFYEE